MYTTKALPPGQVERALKDTARMSTETSSLEQLIDGQADAPKAEAVTPTPEAAPATPGETTAAPPAADPKPADDGPTVPRRALEDERRKRQEYEQKLNELQQYINGQQKPPAPQPQQPQAPPAPDYYADPEGYLRHYHEQVQAHQQRMAEQFQAQLFQTRAETSAELMRSRHADYDEVEKVFVAAAQNAPQLVAEMARNPNPAKFAYDIGRYLKTMSEIGTDPDAYVERKLAERQAATQTETTPAQTPARSAQVPKSLASTTSAVPRARNANGQFSERAPLEDLIG